MNKLFLWLLVPAYAMMTGCSSESVEPAPLNLESLKDTTDIVYTVSGLDGPEAVRYSPNQKAYYISNFTGGGNDQDSTGFITKVDAQGEIVDLKFMTGTTDAPLHAPRGMYIQDKALWVADVLGLHAFDLYSGEQLKFIDFSAFEIGFLNDISADPNGVLYVTDTGNPRVYRVQDGQVSVFLDELEVAPNGITYDPNEGTFVLAPWGGSLDYLTFDDTGEIGRFDGMEGGYIDGIEYVGGVLLSASQQDSSIHALHSGTNPIIIKTTGRPADIGINTHLNHIAVPYIALDRVDIWDLTQ